MAVVNGEEEVKFQVYLKSVADDGLNLGWEGKTGSKDETKI